MAVRSKTLGRVGFLVTLLCLTALLISFASDCWVQSSGNDNTGFENIGLWSVCFKEYYPPVSAFVNRKYDGCWWVLHQELDDLRDFLIPSWYQSTQILVTLCLVLVFIVCIILVINLINCFPYSPYREIIERYLALTSSLLLLLTGILLTIAILLFGVRSSNTGKDWLQNNDENYLSWSFGICILADFLAILAGMILLLQFYRLRSEKGESSSDPKIVLTNEPPPATNYHYSRNNNRARPVLDNGNSNSRDPAYVQRYGKPDESKTSLMSGPPEMFAVSGRGEVYVNNAAMYDDHRDYRDNRYQGPPTQRDNVPLPRNNNTNVQLAPQSHRSNAPRQLGRHGYPLRLQEPSFVPREGGSQDDNRDAKSSTHPSLPEYVPKRNKNDPTSEEDSYMPSDSDHTAARGQNNGTSSKKKKRRDKNDDGGSENGEGRRKSRSRSKSGNKDSRDRSRSNSRSRKKTRTDSETEVDTPSQRRRSKKRGGSSVKGESSDDERSQTRRRSRRRKSSKGRRSKSRDGLTSDSQVDSDTGSTRSRSRRKKKEKEFSRMDAKRRSASEDNLSVRDGRRRSGRSKKKYDGNYSDDCSGSEYSQRRSRSKQRMGRQSGGESRSRHRDFSDTESVKSRTKRSEKPKGTYSSYYEY